MSSLRGLEKQKLTILIYSASLIFPDFSPSKGNFKSLLFGGGVTNPWTLQSMYPVMNHKLAEYVEIVTRYITCLIIIANILFP